VLVPRYAEFPPPPALAGMVAAVWVFALPPGGGGADANFADRVLPDGCVEVICRLADRQSRDRPDEDQIFLRGPLAKFDVVPIPAGSRYAGVRIKPGLAPSVLRVRPAEVRDSRVALADLLPRHAHLFDEAARARTLGAACRILTMGVARSSAHQGAHSGSAVAARAIAAIRHHQGRAAMAEIARGVGCSVRTLHRQVTEAVGLSPKVFSRIVQFRHAVALINRDPRCPLSAVALEAGYADQAHMTREFARLAGLSPARLRGRQLA
jgi:AraC-like DNA-binding protein